MLRMVRNSRIRRNIAQEISVLFEALVGGRATGSARMRSCSTSGWRRGAG
jgi:hypothetical protein